MAFDIENGDYELYETEKEARETAEKFLEIYREESSSEGWPEDLEGRIGYCKVIADTVCKVVAKKENFTDDEWVEAGYSLEFARILDFDLKKYD